MNIFSRRPFGDEPSDDKGRVPRTRANDGRRLQLSLHSRRGWFWGALALIVIVVGFGVWLGSNAFDAKSNLEQAREYAQRAKDALLQGDTDEAAQLAEAAEYHAVAANDATHSVPWSVASAVPWLGGPFETGRQISAVVVGLAANVLKPTADIGVTIAPDQLYRDARVDVQLLREQEPSLARISDNARRLDAEAQQISDPGYLSILRDARSQLQDQTENIAAVIENTALAARLAPLMMGGDGPRTYFMGFQTNAEARGTGGLLGGFGVLRFDNGIPTFENLGKNTELSGAKASINFGPQYDQMYGFTNPYADFRNSNLSSHFPYAAEIWKSMWAQRTGMNVDGVIVIDPVALGYILGAVGPVTMADGEVITKDNVVELTESTVYARFADDQIARKNYLQDIANEVVGRITQPVKSPRDLLDALGKAVGERRIAVWSSVPADQALLEETPLAHVVPDDQAPYAGVVLNNLGGNKMDYYLEREIEYAADGCNGDTRMSTVTIRLRNTLPPGARLPDYVAGTQGLVAGIPFEVPSGTMVTSVRLLATANASLVSALANGERVPVIQGSERGHPAFEVQVLIPPGEAGELTFRMSEPTVGGAPRVPIQPLLDSAAPVVSVAECSD